MSGSQQKPWFDDPNAPKIPYKLYLYEKFSVAGNLVSAILYGARKEHTHPSFHAHFFCPNYSRDRNHVVL